MDLLPRGWPLVRLKVQLAHHAHDLLVDVFPLAHALVRQEVLAAELVKLRLRARPRVLPEAPDLEVRREVAALLAKLAMRFVGALLCGLRPVARVLKAEHRG